VSLFICPFTSSILDYQDARVTVLSSVDNGLEVTSQIMADKVMAIHRSKLGQRIGKLDSETMDRLDIALAFVVGIAA
jgi:mRNA interferase MazF